MAEEKTKEGATPDLLNPPQSEPKQEEKGAPPQVTKSVAKASAIPDFRSAKASDMQSFFMRFLPSISQVLDPKMGDFAKRQMGVAAQLISTTPKLRECTPMSIVGCLRQVALSGLDLSISEICLVPYGGICTYQIQAQGFRKMAYNSGNVSTMNGYIVYEGEIFKRTIEDGIEKIHHEPLLDSYGAKIVAAYGVAIMKDGGKVFRVMPVAEIEKFRHMGMANSPAWKDNYASMCITKAFKHLSKRLPLSFRERAALDGDEMPVEMPENEIVDTTFEVVD